MIDNHFQEGLAYPFYFHRSPNGLYSFMQKIALFPLLLLVACLCAGLYGMVHNQISYTVSPEYFSNFKFAQFNIAPTWHSRIGAALVGWYAAWWMGFVGGLPVLLIGLILPGWKNYLRYSLRAFGIVMLTALLVELAALLYAIYAVPATLVSPVSYPKGIHSPVAFRMAGIMHNYSYLGGLMGVIIAIVYLVGVQMQLSETTLSSLWQQWDKALAQGEAKQLPSAELERQRATILRNAQSAVVDSRWNSIAMGVVVLLLALPFVLGRSFLFLLMPVALFLALVMAITSLRNMRYIRTANLRLQQNFPGFGLNGAYLFVSVIVLGFSVMEIIGFFAMFY